MIHIKDAATCDRARCGETGDMTWTSPESARALATCPECLSDLFSDTCTICDGSKVLKEYDEEWPCGCCSKFAAERFIESRTAVEKGN